MKINLQANKNAPSMQRDSLHCSLKKCHGTYVVQGCRPWGCQKILAPLDFQTFLRPCIHRYVQFSFDQWPNLGLYSNTQHKIQILNGIYFKLGNLKEAEGQTKNPGLRLPAASFLPKNRVHLTVLHIKSPKNIIPITKPQ